MGISGTPDYCHCPSLSYNVRHRRIMEPRPAWYDSVVEESQALVKNQPAGTLVEQGQLRRTKQLRLMELIKGYAIAVKKHGVSAAEQWQNLFPETEEIIYLGLQLGLTRGKAAALAGHSIRTVQKWLQLGLSGYAPFANFRLMIEQIEAMHEIEALGKVEEAAYLEMKTAGTYMRLLERRHPVEAVMPADEPDNELPFNLFTTEELNEYIEKKIIPIRFQRDVIDAVEEETEKIDPEEYERLKQELKEARKKLDESSRLGETAVSKPRTSRRVPKGTKGGSVPVA